MEAMIQAAMTRDAKTLLDAIRMIGGGDVDENHRMARAAMIEAIYRKNGIEACDAIMDEIGI